MNISLPRSGVRGIILGPEQIRGRRHAILQDIGLLKTRKGPCLLPLCVAGSRMAVTLQMNRGWSCVGLDFFCLKQRAATHQPISGRTTCSHHNSSESVKSPHVVFSGLQAKVPQQELPKVGLVTLWRVVACRTVLIPPAKISTRI